MGTNKWFTVSGALFFISMVMVMFEVLSQSSCSPLQIVDFFSHCKIIARSYFSSSISFVALALVFGIIGTVRKQKRGLVN